MRFTPIGEVEAQAFALGRRRYGLKPTGRLIDFTRATMPRYAAAELHERIASALDRVASGECKRLMITVPPQHGKTELASIRFAVKALADDPHRKIVMTAYSAERAEYVNGQARAVAMGDEFQALYPRLKLDNHSQAQTLWRFAGYDGYCKAVGQGGPLTGFGADLLIIDDPIKDREAAESEIQRQKLWDWYTSVAYTRLAPDGAIVVIHTRWHEDDLIGRLLMAQEWDGSDQWEVMHFPAVTEDGVPLWPERYSPADYERIKVTIGVRDWEALFQGRPAPLEGGFIKRKWFTSVERCAPDLRWVRYWDLGVTSKTSSDYTVGLKMAVDAIGQIHIDDVVRGQWDWPDVRERIVGTAHKDGKDVYVAVESKALQTALCQDLLRDPRLMGYPVLPSNIDGDKLTRALAWVGRAAVGGIWLTRGAWNADLVQECAVFNNGTHDDQVDAISGGWRTLMDLYGSLQTQTKWIAPYSQEWLAAVAKDQFGGKRRTA